MFYIWYCNTYGIALLYLATGHIPSVFNVEYDQNNDATLSLYNLRTKNPDDGHIYSFLSLKPRKIKFQRFTCNGAASYPPSHHRPPLMSTNVEDPAAHRPRVTSGTHPKQGAQDSKSGKTITTLHPLTYAVLSADWPCFECGYGARFVPPGRNRFLRNHTIRFFMLRLYEMVAASWEGAVPKLPTAAT